MTSATAAMLITIRPPPPSPCRPRISTSCHILRQPAERGADEKQPNRHLQHDFVAEQIAKFTVQRHRDGGAEDMSRDHPESLSSPPSSPTIVGSAVETMV